MFTFILLLSLFCHKLLVSFKSLLFLPLHACIMHVHMCVLCFYMYVRMNVGASMIQCTCRGQRTISGMSSLFEAGPHSLPCLQSYGSIGISDACYCTRFELRSLHLHGKHLSHPPHISLLPSTDANSFAVGWFCLNVVM